MNIHDTMEDTCAYFMESRRTNDIIIEQIYYLFDPYPHMNPRPVCVSIEHVASRGVASYRT